MIARLLTILFAFLFALPAFSQPAEPFEYGPRPPLSVFDPSGFLNPELVKKISDPLKVIHDKEHIDVLVVILTDLEGAPPEHVARRFAKAWCATPNHSVVLHVPGNKDSPWIVPAGQMIDALRPEEVRQSIEEAQHRAARETAEPDKVRAASVEAADMLRYWTSTALNRSEMMKTETAKFQENARTRARMWRLAAILGAASVIPLVVGISLIVSMAGQRGPRFFPHRAWQFRLGAPHAGGNHAVAKLGPLPP